MPFGRYSGFIHPKSPFGLAGQAIAQLPAQALAGLRTLVEKPQFPSGEDIGPLPATGPPPLFQTRPPAVPPEAEVQRAMTQEPFNRIQSAYVGEPPVFGQMSVTGGGTLDNRTAEALAGLKGLAESRSGGFQPTNAELYRLAGRAPETVAPGAGQYWGHQLQERLGDEAFTSKLQQQQQAAIGAGLAAQHPAIQAGAEVEARRKAYPAQITGSNQLQAAREAILGRAGVEESRASQAERGAMLSHASQLSQAIARLHAKQNPTPEDTDIMNRMAQQLAGLYMALDEGDLEKGQ